MGDVGEVARAVAVAGEIALELLRPDQRRLIADAEGTARRDCRAFAGALLNYNISRCNLMLDGLHRTVLCDLTESERAKLELIDIRVSGASLLGLYQRGRAADLAVTINQIINTAAKETDK
jgi:hypothetical protein